MPGENETTNSETQTEETTQSLATEQATTETEQTSETEQTAETTESETTTEEFVPLTAEDIIFPENFEVQEEFRDEFLTVANNQELSPKDRTQALIDLYVKSSQAASEAISKTWEDTQTKWKDEVKADPEIGGDKLQPTLGRIGRLIDEYGSPEAIAAFNATGAGNNPAIVRLLAKVADKLVEGNPVPGAPTGSEATAAQRMFPSMKG